MTRLTSVLLALLLAGGVLMATPAFAETVCIDFGGVNVFCTDYQPASPPTPPPLTGTPDPQTYSEPGAQGSLVALPGGYRPHLLFLLNNPETTLKTGIFIESIAGGNDTPIANEGVFVFHFSQADNGHDASGITSVEAGNGNAATFQKLVQSRPGGLPVLLAPTSRQYGFAIEAHAQGDGTSIITGSDQGVALAAGVGTFPGAEGVLIYPRVTAEGDGGRVALRVTRYQDNLIATDRDAFRVMLDGTTTWPGLGGVGNAQLCVNAQGTLYRGVPGC
jgi:hypothetical protein